jgi:rRNA maturation protein Nop10
MLNLFHRHKFGEIVTKQLVDGKPPVALQYCEKCGKVNVVKVPSFSKCADGHSWKIIDKNEIYSSDRPKPGQWICAIPNSAKAPDPAKPSYVGRLYTLQCQVCGAIRTETSDAYEEFGFDYDEVVVEQAEFDLPDPDELPET